MTQPQAVQPEPASAPSPADMPPQLPVEPAKTDAPAGKTFTQDEVNSLLADTKRRAQSRYADYDDLKTKAAEFDKLQEDNASELQKAVKAADATARADVIAKTNARVVGAEIKAAAANARFHDPTDAVLRLQREIAGVPVGEDGDVDTDAVKALVDKLAADSPHLVKTDSRPAPLPGQGLHTPSRTPGRDAGKAEAQKRFGKPPAHS